MYILRFPGGSDHKESAVWETWVRFLGQEDPLEKGMAAHSLYSCLSVLLSFTLELLEK